MATATQTPGVELDPRTPLTARLGPILLVALVAASVVGASAIGPVASSWRDVILVILGPLEPLGVHNADPDSIQEALIAAVRLPRAVLAALVGAGLAVAGAAMQAAFRNPLAEPGVTGVSAGAATGAVLVLVLGAGTVWWALPAAAFVGAIAAVAFVQIVGSVGRPEAVTSLLLVGMALNALLGAVISAALANAPDAERARSAMMWLNGDLTGSTWRDVRLTVIPVIVGIAILVLLSRDLDLLSLPDAHAQSAGLRTVTTRHAVLAVAALVTAAGVAVTGVLAFVGLVVPHMVRLVVGPGHAKLLPYSVGIGALVLVAADTAARMTFQPVTLQTGTITALFGAPVLLALVLRRSNGTR